MKKAFIWGLILCLLVVLSGCKGQGTNMDGLNPRLREVARDLNEYVIDGKLDTGNHTLVCRQQVTFTNGTGEKLTELCFHLYPNAFREESKAPFTKAEWGDAYPEGFDAGSITVSNVTVKGEKVAFTLSEDGQILSVPVKLKKNRTITLSMDYTVAIPRCEGRFGRGDDTYNMVNCYPILCRYDEGWATEGYQKVGDPFCSEVANYEVTLTMPEGMIVAATGQEKENKTDGSYRSSTYQAWGVRDFAWVASDGFTVLEKRVGEVEVASYCLGNEGAQETLDTAVRAIETYNALFGDYPYPRLSVVCADFYVGGMEYPMLVMLDRRMYTDSVKVMLEYVTAHEVAHQWWYAVVGNDQIHEAWLDEALTEYTTLLYFRENYSEKVYDGLLRLCVTEPYRERAGSLESQIIDRPTYTFANNEDYAALIYAKGAMMLSAVADLMGREQFLNGLKSYYQENQFEIAQGEELINALEKSGEMPLRGVFDAWLTGKVAIG